MAQFGSALLSGSRGRRFESFYSDVVNMLVRLTVGWSHLTVNQNP